jgi:threonine/homoserine/homoserine lactone efflux protein
MTMLEWSSLIVFMIAAAVLLVVPGPAVLYIVARSVNQGRLAGIVSALGIQIGTLFHIVAAALGVSAILVTSARAFQVVKFLGAAYLVYLGIRTLLDRKQPDALSASEPQELSRIFYQGVIVNLLNPKTALFFFAFLPQFADPARGPVALQILLLGVIFVTMAICSDSIYALLAGTIGRSLKSNLAVLRGQRYFAGFVYIALGVTTALSRADTK